MRLPASIVAQPPGTGEASHLPAAHVDPTEVSDVEPTAAKREPWWVRASGVIAEGVFINVAAVLIAVTGAIYVGMYHAPWVKSLADHRPNALQAGDAMSVATAAAPANAATPAPPTEPTAPPALSSTSPSALPSTSPPDHVAAARNRMEQRIYSQVPSRTRKVVENETLNEGAPARDSEASASGNVRHHHRSPRQTHYRAPGNAAWYKGA